MKKRIVSILLAAVLLCTLLPQITLISHAETYSGACGDNLTWSLNTETGKLTVKGSGEMKDYGMSPYPWSQYRASIKSVSLPNGLTSIGSYAFELCTGLTSVTIPASVTKIGYRVFGVCTGLTSVTIPNSVTEIEQEAFSGCRGLTSITIPARVTRIGRSAFSGCTGLTSVTIPASVTEIGEQPFNGCTGLEKIKVATGNTCYSSDTKGVLFDKNKSNLICCPGG